VATALIFVSSVQKELVEERRAVKAFVECDPLLRRYFTVFLFEDLPASDRRADEVYIDEVDRCVVYVGLFGNNYGFEDAEGVSPTEREFDRATLRAKPRLIFVKGADDRARHSKMGALVSKAGDPADSPALWQHSRSDRGPVCQPRRPPRAHGVVACAAVRCLGLRRGDAG
jgi:ATP-dependent DNA helicase RecG